MDYDDEDTAFSPTEPFKDNDSVIQDCLQAFATKDHIMEPAVYNMLKRYLHAGGAPEEFVKLLSENYTGAAQSANLLANWLILTGSVSVHEVEQIVEDHLKTLILRNFDAKKADTIFTEEGGTPPWLESMITHGTWRSLFYQLAEVYPDCLMLNFTIKLISDAGYEAEITSISTACHQMEVFSRVLKTSITGFLEGGEENVQKHLDEFTKMVCHGQHTYLYTQCMLHLLAQMPQSGPKLRRLSQEVRKTAKQQGHEVSNIGLALDGTVSYPRVFTALSSMMGRQSLNPGDITVLYKLYNTADPPPVGLIRLPKLLEMLTNALFKPGCTLNPEHKPKYIFLLAYAACVHETWEGNKRVAKHVDELKATNQALERVQAVCSRETSATSHQLSAEVGMLYQCTRYPVVAMGILKWVDYTLSDPTFFKTMTDSTPVHLALLDEVSTCHPLQHPLVLALLVKLFEAVTPLDTLVELEFKKTVLDRMIHLLSRGYVVPVILYIRKCMESQDTDISLIRHFVTEVLDMIAPPYSSEFIHLFLPIVKNEPITGNLRNADGTDDVSAFIAHCERLEKEGRS